MRDRLRLEYIAGAGAAGILIWLLFTSPFVGMADNGDFLRVMMTAGLDYNPASVTYEDRFFGWANSVFAYDNIRGVYITSQLIPVFVARTFGWLYDGSLFNIRFLGAVYGALLVAAIFMIVRSGRGISLGAAFTLGAGMLFFFLDIHYVAYFNSFFAEPLSLVFLLLTVGAGVRLSQQEKPTIGAANFFFFCIFMLVCSKLQNTPLGIVMGLYCLRLLPLRWDKAWRRCVIWGCSMLFLLSTLLYLFAPDGLKQINLYQTVFFGILNKSPDVKGDLQDLGLPEKLAVNAGTNYFQSDAPIKQDAPEMQGDFYDRMSHGKVMLYYVTHPQRLMGLLERAVEYGVNMRIGYLGNYEKAEGQPPLTLSNNYSAWSTFKAKYMPSSLLFLVLFYLVYYAVCVMEWLRSRSTASRITAEMLMLIGFVGLFSLVVPVMGDGMADINKHLFLYSAAFDMMLLASAAWLVHRIGVIISSRRSSRSAYGSYRF
ncbi:hypothetical protein [Paenibacillus herberti]|uniref:Glycosyltransferase RgtA/B/C/D-like domain-containing protein n=1 Tax=Paenibacillus herberti TaxID=1619309 RepID=A0A229NUE4_9BACL|nr:hypothetical protein [Paenibacillus herberti]OXM13482.1 hypothetical protein CGZ75_20795 [Paenibacillus herberti]